MFFPDIKRNDIWKIGYNKTVSIENKSNIFKFKNIRNFSHKNQNLKYFDDFYDIEKLDQIILHSIPFGFKKVLSHFILEFQFLDSKKVFLSVEARRQRNEGFSIFKGFFKHYGLIYIWGTEEDLIGLRRDIRKNKIDSYVLKLSKQGKKLGFKYFINRTNELKNNPEFYHIFLNNCVVNLWRILKIKSRKNINFSWELIFSAYIKTYLKKYDLLIKDL